MARSVRFDCHGTPQASAQRNFPDPESRIMERGRQFTQAYNGHIAVDDEWHVIVGQGASNQALDTASISTQRRPDPGRRPSSGCATKSAALQVGPSKARGEWGLVCLRHNARRLHAARVAGRTAS